MDETKAVRLHLTNIAGVGAVQLLKSLLPAIERAPGYRVEKMYVADVGDFASHIPARKSTMALRYRRHVPNAISRFLECTVFSDKFDGETPLLVLGDIPLRCSARQTVFVQTVLVTDGSKSGAGFGGLKYRVSRWLFGYNADRVSAFIVQTEAMKTSLIASYPQIADRVHVTTSPVPEWLLRHPVHRTGPRNRESGLHLFYPAASYPHKNHQLLKSIPQREGEVWPVAELRLTIPPNENPNPRVGWIRCVDRLSPDEMIAQYENADALLFLSRAESLGLPLVEAMWIGLPIICPDLPYARTLCGEVAIYFDPGSVSSLREAILELRRRLDAGWWPDWKQALAPIPRDWDEVAATMLEISTRAGSC